MAQSMFVVAYDGQDHPVIDAAVRLAKTQSAGIHVVHVIDWSPYQLLTQEELAARHAKRQAEIADADTSVLQPVLAEIRALGIPASGQIRHGDTVDVVSAIAVEQQADLIFVGRSNSLSERVFGSVASGLAARAPVPVVVVP